MFDNTVTRFPPGLNNTKENGILSDMFIPDRIWKVHEYSNDFDQYIAGDWTLSGAGATAALIAGDGGLLLVSAAVSTFASLQKLPANYQLAKGFRTWFEERAALDSLVGVLLVGLLNATATPFTPASQTDGAYFLSITATGALTFNIAVGGVITTVQCGVNLVAGLQAKLAFYYDAAVYAAGFPNGRVLWEASGPGVTAPARGEIVVPVASVFPGAVNLAETLAVNAPTAVVRTLTVDTLYAAKDRTNINATPAF